MKQSLSASATACPGEEEVVVATTHTTSSSTTPCPPTSGHVQKAAEKNCSSRVSRCPLSYFRRAQDEFDRYQAKLPFQTVVPKPAHTLREHITAMVLFILRKGIWALFLLITFPIWVTLHFILIWMNHQQRKEWLLFQQSWPHHSVPHVRPVRFKADAEFPLEKWHLRCEDGRQRWYFGEPLAQSEEGNTLGAAQVYGYDTADAYRHHGSNSNNTTHDTMLKNEDLLAAKIEHRKALERYQLGLQPKTKRRLRETSEDAMRDSVDFLLKLQDPFSGHWPNDYSGCMFLTPGVIITKFIIGNGNLKDMFPPCEDHVHIAPQSQADANIDDTFIGVDVDTSRRPSTPSATRIRTTPCRCGEAMRRELIRYLRNYQNQDGGWGQHTEGHSTMLGTVLSYVSMRMLGVTSADTQLVAAREWIQAEGGAVKIPMWGKMWLCIAGLFSYDGICPLPPEMVLMPDWVPFSEGRAWCHSRVIAIPFSYFYGLRWSAPPHPLLDAIRKEIYTQPYESIAWRQVRHEVCPKDLYTPSSRLFRFAAKLMDVYERHHISFLRRYALEVNWKHIAYDDENTNFICLGPVNKSLNMLVTWLREGDKSPRFKMHTDRLPDYFFMGPTGMRMNGYNGSQLWDTSFAVQAVCASRSELLHPAEMALAHHYTDIAQVQEDPIAAATFYRHRTKGAWNFSTSPQGWQVSDCTAEGLRVMLLLGHLPFPTQRIYDAVDEILSLRNSSGDGGWASYEPTRSPAYCELLNCAELFKDVMVEYSYAECSSSCVHTLALFRERYPHYRRRDVDVAISEGIACVLGKQRPDGSYYGSWAVCFTYAAWIVSDALYVSGELGDMANHPHCVRLIDFLLKHQNADGGWGEDINSCVRQVWVANPDGSQVVNTAWAVMAIMCAAGEDKRSSLPRRQRLVTAVQRGIQLIMSRQLDSGDWEQERISGVFNGNNPIHYPGYKNSMTVWALGKYNVWKREYTAS